MSINIKTFQSELPATGQIIQIYPKSGNARIVKRCPYHCHGSLFRVEIDHSLSCVRCKCEFQLTPEEREGMGWSYVYNQPVPVQFKKKEEVKAPINS